MPTSKPRITITLTEHQHQVLSSLAKLQKVSMSAIVVDFLDTTIPVLERLTGVLEAAANAPQEVRDKIRQSAEAAEMAYGHLPAEIEGQLGLMIEAAAGVEALTSDAAPAAAEDVRPPTSNRGVRISTPRSKNRSDSSIPQGRKGVRK